MAHQILVFAKVVEGGSFTAAARALEMPKSTVSRKVAELEARLGARLLQRTTRTLQLTEAGRAYYGHAARVMDELEAAEAAVHELTASPRGRLRVTVPLNFAQLGPIFARFLVRYPEVELEVVCADRVVDLVEEGFDVAIRAGALADSRLIARSLSVMRSFVVASPTYLAQHGAPAQPEALARAAGLMFGSGTGRTGWVLERSGRAVTVRPQPRLVVNDFELLREATLCGIGVALLPAIRCGTEIERGTLIRLLPEWSSPATPVHAVYPSARQIPPKLRAFLDHLDEETHPAPWDQAPVARAKSPPKPSPEPRAVRPSKKTRASS